MADHRIWGSDETLMHRGPLILTGTFRAPAFSTLVLGDVFVEGLEMEYGEGYCLPIGYRDAARQAIHPRHGSRASRALLNVDHVDESTPHRFLDTIRCGKSVFRTVRM